MQNLYAANCACCGIFVAPQTGTLTIVASRPVIHAEGHPKAEPSQSSQPDPAETKPNPTPTIRYPNMQVRITRPGTIGITITNDREYILPHDEARRLMNTLMRTLQDDTRHTIAKRDLKLPTHR